MENASTTDEDALIKEMTDIYDIKPPRVFGVNPAWIRFALALFSVILVLFLLFMAYRLWSKRRRPVESHTPALSPEERALAGLRNVKTLMNTDGKEFYFRLSAVYREYIQDRYGVEALEMTSEELIPNIKKLAIDLQLKTDSRSFIELSDPVKFTDIEADPVQMEAHYGFVRTFIDKTTPIPTVMEQGVSGKSVGG